MSDKTWQEMSDNELLHLHSLGKMPVEAERAIGEEQLRLVVAWDGANGPRPALRPEPAKAPGPDYESMTKDDLINILKGRPGNLSALGRKTELIERLRASDAGEEDEESGDDNDADSEDEGDDSEDDGDETPEPEKPKSKPKKQK